MVITKMKETKIECRKCDCLSLNCGIKNQKKWKTRVYKTIHTFTERTEGRTNNNYNNNNNTNTNDNNDNNNNNNNE